ncbi:MULTISPECIES: methyltransferase domain-containing protein [unclassified Minwuia]|jgi:ubiquinone/menaquinone biosynthesis C-methylase UbiE|uniref:class I SAM-dependent methyltransferase n=1 Tax=unclassified Minwuia TaxID=2618799 RepID=UPI00247AE97C|nr:MULTISPECIES: methyltransferase domain-containing protein [unclassified Minwuia]
MQEKLEDAVATHYGRDGLLEDILAGLEKLGGNPDDPAPEQLAAVDEFHTAGRITTLEALGMAPLREGMHVLDAGCGIGGTARVLARDFGCRVTGIDLTPQYVDVARKLTARMKLDTACEFQTGNVLAMPFPDGAFDAAVTFHVAMNIPDRGRLYGELARVLRPGATLCLFDVMKGAAPGMVYPVPWAETEATSFLRTPSETRNHLVTAGFSLDREESRHSFAVSFFREVLANAARAGSPPPLGLHLLTGQNSPEKFANYLRGLEAGQIDPVIMVATRL